MNDSARAEVLNKQTVFGQELEREDKSLSQCYLSAVLVKDASHFDQPRIHINVY